MILETAIGLPAKHAKQAKTKGEMDLHQKRCLHPAGERLQQQRQGGDAVGISVFSVFSGPIVGNESKSPAAFD
jgi:hypothetical protein